MTTIFEPGSVIGGLVELLELIDTGGQAEVWVVRDLTFPERSKLALKIYYIEWDKRNEPTFKQRSERLEGEVRLIGSILHRFIVNPHFVVGGKHDAGGEPYFYAGVVMDLASDRSMQDFILTPAYRKFSPRDKLIFLKRLADGLDATHSFQIVHNDIKTKNILIFRENNQYIPRYVDFGMSFKQGTAAVLGGTPAYMAPELLNESSIPNFSTDIFSLGIVFYEFITGNHPLHNFMKEGHDLKALFRGYYATNQYISIPDNVAFDRPQFANLIKRMCSRSPEERPNIVEIRRILDEIETDVASTSIVKVEEVAPALANKFKWNMKVHEIFNEQEFFYFVTGSRPDQDFVWLDSQLAQKHIFGYSIYRLIGATDFVLRAWLGPSAVYHVNRVFEDYQRQRFGTSRLFLPSTRVPSIPLRAELATEEAVRRTIAALSSNGELDLSQEELLRRQRVIIGRAKSFREKDRADTRRRIRVLSLVTTKAPFNERFAELIAKSIFDELAHMKHVKEVEVFADHGRNANPGEFLILCELPTFHEYRAVFEFVERLLLQINGDLVNRFATHLELDATSLVESYDGSLVYEVSRRLTN